MYEEDNEQHLGVLLTQRNLISSSAFDVGKIVFINKILLTHVWGR